MIRAKLFHRIYLVLAMLSVAIIPTGAQGDENEFKRIAYFYEFKGPVDFINDTSGKPLRLLQCTWGKEYSRNVLFYDWDEKKKQYVMAEQEYMSDEDFSSTYENKGLVFLRDSDWKDNDVFLPNYNRENKKQLMIEANIGGQKLKIYVTIKSTDSYEENAVLSIYVDKGRFSKCIYEDSLIASSIDMVINKVIVCDVNRDKSPEILVGICDGGQEAFKMFIYGLEDNPWEPQIWDGRRRP